LRREAPLLLTFLFGAFYVLSNFIVWERWKLAAENINNWVFIVIAFTYVLGVGNVLRIHGLKISRRESGWGYSAATLAGLFVMILFGVVLWFLPRTEGEATVRFKALAPVVVADAVRLSAPTGSGDLFDVLIDSRLAQDANGDGSAGAGDEIECRLSYGYMGPSSVPDARFPLVYDSAALSPVLEAGAPFAATDTGLVWSAGMVPGSWFGKTGAGNGQRSVYTWFYDAVYVPMQSTMFALLAFFISSAAFRAFRLRSVHAVLLGATALVVILGSVPVGEAVWANFPPLVAWVMNCLQTAGKRAILIGAALGAIATGLKMIVGAEKGYLGRE
jgi:hypothetical protein